MRILWLCNVMLPKIAEDIGETATVFGGWLNILSDELQKYDGTELTVCFPLNRSVKGQIDKYKYCSFIKEKDASVQFEEILEEYKPDIVHIFGTENKHTFDMVNACERKGLLDNVVIGIQGLVSVIARHYTAFLPSKVTRAYSFRDFIKGRNIKKSQKAFLQNGKYEVSSLKRVKHIMGRTDWDRACTSAINDRANYYLCNEILRKSFYENAWKGENCEKHSIFVSQCSYPIKGFHIMLEALSDIVKTYPDAVLYTTGKNPLGLTFKQRLRQTYYSKYIGKLIKQYGLQNNVRFLGLLNETEMCERYINSNVFVSCSSIENSPNSVGEAMLLGVPTVSSDVGGVKNMLTHGEEGFVYQADAPYMLAYYIKKLFSDEELQNSFSKKAKQHAAQTHAIQKNIEDVVNVYKKLMED